MSDPFVRKTLQGRYILVGGAIITGVLVISLVVGGLIYMFMDYQSTGVAVSGEMIPVQVSINNPNQGTQIAAGDSLFVNTKAIGPKAFLSMELWVDGDLAGVQAAPSGGVRPFSTSFLWLPKEPGYHSLIAAAIDAEGQKTISPQVVVVITQEEGAGDIITPAQDDSVTVLPAPAGGVYTPPNPPGSDDSVGPANVSSSSPGDLIDGPDDEASPAAPELVVNAGQCAANLSIHDLSDNERGFILYRQAVNSPTWQQIATLNPQSQNDWLTYTDDSLAGALTYYVSAFNSNGETASNLALVNIDPANCPGEPVKTTAITIEVIKLMPELNAELNYCYLSTDGMNWSRWPQFGFLTPGEDNLIPGGSVFQMASTGFDGQPVTKTLDLYMECWGWQGTTLQFLGDFFIEGMEPEHFGSQIVPGTGLSAEIVVDPTGVLGETEFYPMGGGGYDIGLAGESYPELKQIHPEIPGVFLWHTTDYQKCDEHLLSYDPTASTLAWCRNPYPEYGDSQPYLIWFPGPGSGGAFDLRPGCTGGGGCKSVEELLALAEETGGQVGIELITYSSFGYETRLLKMPRPPLEIVPPLECTGDMWFNVSLWYRPGGLFDVNTGPQTYYGPMSNWVSLPCYVEPTHSNIQYLDITFTELSLSNLDDDDTQIATGCIGPGSCDDVEVYGYFKVHSPPNYTYSDTSIPGPSEIRWYLNLATWDAQGEYCPDDITDYFTSPGSGCPPNLFGTSYNLSTFELCQSRDKEDCETGFLKNNNTLRVYVTHGDAIGLELAIYDWDDASANDLVCQRTVFTPSQSLEQWSNYHDMHLVNTDATDSGQCSMQVEIKAVNP